MFDLLAAFRGPTRTPYRLFGPTDRHQHKTKQHGPVLAVLGVPRGVTVHIQPCYDDVTYSQHILLVSDYPELAQEILSCFAALSTFERAKAGVLYLKLAEVPITAEDVEPPLPSPPGTRQFQGHRPGLHVLHVLRGRLRQVGFSEQLRPLLLLRLFRALVEDMDFAKTTIDQFASLTIEERAEAGIPNTRIAVQTLVADDIDPPMPPTPLLSLLLSEASSVSQN
ncbi:hypothetical protein CSOJ01_03852 [Colletotrichum sojae]|uniref:Uncharacterized protein n=1 Tax=Colletotrichum sojae TaxID=2175907 RepID=A0A8H6JLL9_9PEZI|nr:hypothetical protein CSOJ01_03852 [Colletotrichum sojae]